MGVSSSRLEKRSIIKWDMRNGSRLATLHKLRPGGGKGKERVTTEPPGHSDDGRYLASTCKDRRVGVWDAKKGEWVRDFGGHWDTISVRALHFQRRPYALA